MTEHSAKDRSETEGQSETQTSGLPKERASTIALKVEMGSAEASPDRNSEAFRSIISSLNVWEVPIGSTTPGAASLRSRSSVSKH